MASFDVPPPPPTEPTWNPPAHRTQASRRIRLLAAALALALVVATITTALAYTQRQEVERLRTELAAAEERVAELETRLAEGGGGAGLGELFGDLFGDGDGALDGLLDGLLEGGLDGLLDGFLGDGLDGLPEGADPADLSRCLAGDGLGALLGGGDPVVADDLPAQVDAIAERVAALRGLAVREPVSPDLLPTAEFTALVTELVSEDYTAADADLDRRVLAALGAVDPAADLRSMVLDLVGEQAAGFYDTDTAQLVVRADDPEAVLGPAGQMILAHEIQHAIADQHLGMPVDDDAPEDADGAHASLALVEGDATLLMQQFAVDALDLMDRLAVASDPSVAGSQEQLEAYPAYLQRELVFPYTEGMAFVCDLYASGGWAAVDAAYADPPVTTAQILWPERYAAGEDAIAPDGLGTPGGEWSQAHTDTFGAAELLWLFAAPGDDTAAALDVPLERAAAWAGGHVELWTDGDDSAVGIALVQRPDERDLCGSMTAWHDAAFPDARSAAPAGAEKLAVNGPGQAAVIVCTGDSVRVGIGPDLATAREVAG